MDNNAAKLADRIQAVRPNPPSPAEKTEEELLCYGSVLGNRRAFNIEFRRLGGSWPMLEYAWLQRADWCPVEVAVATGVVAAAGSFLLKYSSGETVVVMGRNLRAVYQKLLEHQVKYLAEADRPSEMLAQDDAPVVSRLHVIEPSPSRGR